MTIAENLFNNLLVVFILIVLFIIIYCRIKQQSLVDIYRELKGVADE